MKGQLGGAPTTPDDEPEPEVWSPETLRRRSEQIQLMGLRNESRCEELELSDTERSQSRSTERSRSQTSSDSQVLVGGGAGEDIVRTVRRQDSTCTHTETLCALCADRTALVHTLRHCAHCAQTGQHLYTH